MEAGDVLPFHFITTNLLCFENCYPTGKADRNVVDGRSKYRAFINALK